MNNEPIKQKISILSSDEATIRLLGKSPLSNLFSSEILPATISLEQLLGNTADVLVLDEENPFNLSVIDLCKIIRAINDEVVIILLANDFDVTAKILALELGADDYLEKPANRLEIMARIKVTLRRMNYAEEMALEANEFKFNDLYLDAKRRICIINGNELKLSNYEFLTLLHLVKSKGKPVARELLLNDVWGLPSDEKTRPVDDIVRRLRKKLREQESPIQILAVWGHGYRIEAE